MRKIMLLAFFLFSSVFLLLTNKVFSQEVPVVASQNWKCMRGDPQALTFNGVSSSTISQELYADGYTVNSEAYIVSCVGAATGGVCTTGSAEYDKLIFGADNSASFPYPVTITGGSKKQIELGKLKAVATVTTQGLTGGLTFYGVTVGVDDSLVGKGPAQKLAEAAYVEAVTTQCVSISWNTVFPPPPPEEPPRTDPFGIVFDSQSLEPLPNVSVTVLDKNKNIFQRAGLTNPQTTKADGLFNFLVPPGVYYLTTSLPSGYKFLANPNLHPNYVKIYHKMDGSNSIYKPDEPITELSGIMEHRDIPLDPGTNSPYSVQPSTINYQMYREAITTIIEGKVSHPFTEVSFTQGATLITKVTANRFGFYKAKFNNTNLSQDEDISAVYTKADLKKINSVRNRSLFDNFFSFIFSPVVPEAVAQSAIKITYSKEAFKLSPILPYIEGYAYDQNGKVQPNATVNLKLKMNKATIYSMKTDSKGYFKILPKYIPLFPYYLDIIPVGGGLITYSPSEFAKKNKEYLDNNKINLADGTKDNKSLLSITPAPTKPYAVNADQNSKNTDQNTNKQNVATSKNGLKISTILPIILTILIFFVLVGVTIFFIIKNKNTLPPTPTSTPPITI